MKLEQIGTAAPFTDGTRDGTYTTPFLNPVPADLHKLRRDDQNPVMYKPPTAVGFALNANESFTAIKPEQFARLT